MTTKLVMIHGRSQENLDAVALKAEWVSALRTGLNHTLPLQDADIRFPYYGDTLYSLAHGVSGTEVPEIIVRGDTSSPDGLSEDQRQFLQSVLEEMRKG